MGDPVRFLIHGGSGRMGRALLRLCAEGVPAGCTVVAAVSRRPPQRVVDGVPQFSTSELSGVPRFDVAIDFSLPEGFDPLLALCRQRGAALVSGTTGLSGEQRQAMADAATGIPVLWAANFSLGVAVLEELVERAAGTLAGWDCDIVETHHVHKKDAPSGTALALGAAAEQAGAGPRYASLRAGDVVGEHLVQFTGPGERIELVHRATSRDVFARGALLAASRLRAMGPGAWRLRDLLQAP
ncbi:4-hydroxy-tetrahydrodipicolinate reductase [Luteimonas sp. MJ246]|uniref:4-hydroxy-tetrahydrodipicolinate reductase n=1 Tax=Luteimonas sp. MJ174 TaxID=3129237 RepID=UPI0031BAFD19